MGHILLLILKILGILILVIVGLLVFLCACVLFIPVRYSLTGKKTESETTVKLRFHWFLHILSFYGCYESEEFSTRFRIFGIPLKSKKEPKKNDENEETATEQTQNRIEHDNPTDSNTPLNTTSAKETSDSITNVKKELHQTDSGWIEKIKHQLHNLKCICLKLWTTLKRVCASTHSFLEFIQADATKQTFTFIKTELKYLFKHLKPRNIKGELIIGFEDPSVTGQFLAVSSLFYPFLGEQVKLHPDFENEVLEGAIQIRGHIRAIHALRIVWHIFRNNNIMQIIKKFQNKH